MCLKFYACVLYVINAPLNRASSAKAPFKIPATVFPILRLGAQISESLSGLMSTVIKMVAIIYLHVRRIHNVSDLSDPILLYRTIGIE